MSTSKAIREAHVMRIDTQTTWVEQGEEAVGRVRKFVPSLDQTDWSFLSQHPSRLPLTGTRTPGAGVVADGDRKHLVKKGLEAIW